MKLITILSILSIVLWNLSESFVIALKRKTQDQTSKIKSNFVPIVFSILIFSIPVGIILNIFNIAEINYNHDRILLISIILIFICMIIRLYAIYLLKKQFTINLGIISDHLLFKENIYKFIRHPSYLGYIISVIGISLVYTNWISLIIINIPIIIAILNRIKIEEKLLLSHFRKEYENYSSSTKKIIPFVY